jgi:hypothetical protein
VGIPPEAALAAFRIARSDAGAIRHGESRRGQGRRQSKPD